MGVRNPHSFHFPIRKFDDNVGLYKNFRYLEDFLLNLSLGGHQSRQVIIAPHNSINKGIADVVLTGNDASDESTMIALLANGKRDFRFLDGTVTGTLTGNLFANRPQASVSVTGLGPGVTIWDVPTARSAIISEDNTDPANSDELITSITGISFNLSASTSTVFSAPVWRVYMWNCEIYGGNEDGIGDGDSDSRGAIVWGNSFRDIGNGAGDHAIVSPRGWIITNNIFQDINDSAIMNPRGCVIGSNYFSGSNTSIDFQNSAGDDNVIVGNRFDTTTVFANLTAGSNLIGFNWPADTIVTGIAIDVAVPDWVTYLDERLDDETADADDDFFGDATKTGWTENTVTGTATWTELRGVMSLKAVSGATGDAASSLKAITASGPPLTIETCVRMFDVNDDFHSIGICFTDGTSSTSNIVQARLASRANGTDQVQAYTGTLTDTDNTSRVLTTLNGARGGLLYIRLVQTAANTWAVNFSQDSVSWSDLGLAPFSFTMTPTHYGIFATNFSGTTPLIASWEYFRVYEASLDV